MITIRNILIAGGIGLLGVFLYFYFQGDEARIRKQFKRLSEWSTKWPDDEKMVLAGRSHKIRGLFMPSVSLHVGEDRIAGHYTQQDIGSLALNTLTYFITTHLRFKNLDVRIPSPTEAHVRFSAQFTAQDPDGSTIDEYRDLMCVLRKVEDVWLFESFDAGDWEEN